LKNISIQESRAPTPEREEVLPLNPMKDPQQCEVTMLREDKNNNGKMNLVTQIKGKKARNLSKKKAKLEKLQEVPERNSQKGRFTELEIRRNIRITQIDTSPQQRNIIIGAVMTIRTMLQND
jgi:hypothetical protein